jgi:hypothetical protein
VGLSLAQDKPTGNGDKDTLGKAAVLGYAANLHAFPFYTCLYKYTKGQAKSVEDALQGKFLNAASFDCRLIVDEEKDLYESLAPPVPPDAKRATPIPGKKGVSLVPASPITSNRYMADGKRELSYCPQLNTLGLWSNDISFRGLEDPTPLGMLSIKHRGRQGPDVLMSRPDEFEMHSDGMEEIDGRPAVSVRFRNKKYNYVLGFSFDVGRGYLPIRGTTIFDGKLKSQKYVTHVRECSNQRWFLDRIVVVDVPDRGALYDVTELRMLEFDADRRPDASAFYLTIPAGTVVNTPHDPKKRFTLKQDEKIHIGELSNLSVMLDRSAITPLMDTAIPSGGWAPWLRWTLGIAGIALALAGAWYLLRRRLRSQVG